MHLIHLCFCSWPAFLQTMDILSVLAILVWQRLCSLTGHIRAFSGLTVAMQLTLHLDGYLSCCFIFSRSSVPTFRCIFFPCFLQHVWDKPRIQDPRVKLWNSWLPIPRHCTKRLVGCSRWTLTFLSHQELAQPTSYKKKYFPWHEDQQVMIGLVTVGKHLGRQFLRKFPAELRGFRFPQFFTIHNGFAHVSSGW